MWQNKDEQDETAKQFVAVDTQEFARLSKQRQSKSGTFKEPLTPRWLKPGCAGFTSVKLRLFKEQNSVNKPAKMHKKLMAEVNAKKRKIVKDIFGGKIYKQQKEAYLHKKREPMQKTRESLPQTFNDISEIPLVTPPIQNDLLNTEPRHTRVQSLGQAKKIKDKYVERSQKSPLEMLENLSQDEKYRMQQAFQKKEQVDILRPSTPKIQIVDMEAQNQVA